jgi:hypothetical protein
MRHVLHLIKDPANRTALDVVARQAHDPEVRLSVVLLHAAADLELPGLASAEAFRLDDGPADAPAGPGSRSPYPRITHSGLLDLIFSADSVVTW